MTVISVEHLSKSYRLGAIGGGTLRADVSRWLAKLQGKEDPNSKIGEPNRKKAEKLKTEKLKSENNVSMSACQHVSISKDVSVSAFKKDVSVSDFSPDLFWALRDVSFEVKQGEILGIIGRNGAGKSTLLKILSRVTAPTSGQVKIKGRIASLLEVGTGFHPELTGRENIFLNGAILGMTKAEIKRKFDEIVDFSGVEQFLDTPVKRYSSGMYVRLAFAVAAHLEPEILIVDEVLAVGDAEFQKKCLGKMKDVSSHGRTVLFVSHNMTAVQTLCRRALMLSTGKLIADDSVAPVVVRYLREAQGSSEGKHWTDPQTAPGNALIRIKEVRILPDGDSSTDLLTMQTPLRVETEYWVVKVGAATHLTYHLINDQGIIVLTSGCSSQIRQPGIYKAVCTIPGQLLNSGGYFLKLLIVENENQVTYENDGIASFTVVDAAERNHAHMGREPGVVQPQLEWITECRSIKNEY
jgi:lipopolysaccharide transport system ATP-binding protein